MLWTCMVCAYVIIATLFPSPLVAETRYVQSESIPLNVRSGPGTEHTIVTRLAHGTQVSLLERWGLWARIATPQGDTEGWVLQRYLVPNPPPAVESSADMSPEEEQRRFSRLQRKGILTLQRPGTTGLLRLTINPLIWRHLTPQEQHNFLQRAQRLFGGSSVDIYDQHTEDLLARLTGTGELQSMPPASGHDALWPPPPTRTPAPTPPPVTPR